jgi:myo-inositol-1-phosphate synthase
VAANFFEEDVALGEHANDVTLGIDDRQTGDALLHEDLGSLLAVAGQELKGVNA